MLHLSAPAMDACPPAAGVGCPMQPCLCMCGHSLTHWPPACRPTLPLTGPPWMCAWRSTRMWLVAMRSSPLFRLGTGSADSQWARSTRPTCGRSVRAGRSLLVHVAQAACQLCWIWRYQVLLWGSRHALLAPQAAMSDCRLKPEPCTLVCELSAAFYWASVLQLCT